MGRMKRHAPLALEVQGPWGWCERWRAASDFDRMGADKPGASRWGAWRRALPHMQALQAGAGGTTAELRLPYFSSGMKSCWTRLTPGSGIRAETTWRISMMCCCSISAELENTRGLSP